MNQRWFPTHRFDTPAEAEGSGGQGIDIQPAVTKPQPNWPGSGWNETGKSLQALKGIHQGSVPTSGRQEVGPFTDEPSPKYPAHTVVETPYSATSQKSDSLVRHSFLRSTSLSADDSSFMSQDPYQDCSAKEKFYREAGANVSTPSYIMDRTNFSGNNDESPPNMFGHTHSLSFDEAGTPSSNLVLTPRQDYLRRFSTTQLTPGGPYPQYHNLNDTRKNSAPSLLFASRLGQDNDPQYRNHEHRTWNPEAEFLLPNGKDSTGVSRVNLETAFEWEPLQSRR